MVDGKSNVCICFIFVFRVAYILGSCVETVNPLCMKNSQQFAFQIVLQLLVLLYPFTCFLLGGNRNCNTEVVQCAATLNARLVKNKMYFYFSFSKKNHPLGSLLQVFTLVNKHNVV